tara:strand:+ start:6656 stop:7636 length:981 start_codon:yes stop_codon:yes gene_type:complete
MDFIDERFISLLSSRLQKFKKIKLKLYNFRCPYCGDSKKNKNKARGFLYAVKNNSNYKCHNCGTSVSFSNFLKDLDPNLYKEYRLEKFKEGHSGGKNFVVEEPKFEFKKPVFKTKLKLPKASKSPEAHGYLLARKLDPDKFYYAEKFKEFYNTLKPNTFEDTKNDHGRIIIPFYNEENQLIGLQGRAIYPNIKPKYLTLMLSENQPKIYGLDKINKQDSVYVTEGPFDSTFLLNAIAMCGADADVSRWGISDPVWIFDNEPRNTEIVNRIQRTIDNGGRLVIWPESIEDKDINDMVMSGLDVQSVIKSNTYSGLEAKLKFNSWKKI